MQDITPCGVVLYKMCKWQFARYFEYVVLQARLIVVQALQEISAAKAPITAVEVHYQNSNFHRQEEDLLFILHDIAVAVVVRLRKGMHLSLGLAQRRHLAIIIRRLQSNTSSTSAFPLSVTMSFTWSVLRSNRRVSRSATQILFVICVRFLFGNNLAEYMAPRLNLSWDRQL